METTEAKCRRLIAEHLKIDPDLLTPSATLESIGADSLDNVELVMLFEEEFRIEIGDDEIAGGESRFDEIVKLIEGKLTALVA